MDVLAYYGKRREMEQGLPEPCVVVSLATENGGKAGVKTEVRRALAAKMIVEGCVRQASEEEAQAFHDEKREAKRVADQLAAASRMQLIMAPQSEWRKKA